MKKYLITLALLFQSVVFANFNDIYVADIKYDWINKSELEKEAMIQEVKENIFIYPINKQKNFKSEFKEKIKDKNHVNNYLAASAGYKEYNGNNIGAFYYKKMKSIFMYALQDKNDLSKSFYYDALGNLKLIDFIQGEYPDYPYTVIQYKMSGEPISVIYYVSKDCQYLFTPKGEFEGVWYKYNLYNKASKVILKRTSY